jgi:ribose/xylose/arabinose/galactoside ABC-type transport system permease subunit
MRSSSWGFASSPFVVTLSTLFLFRGFGAWLTESRQLDFPASLRAFGQSSVLGHPRPHPIFAAVALLAHLVLRHTAFGRHVLRLRHDPLAARKAGLPVRRIEATVYVISGTLSALAGFVLISQIGRLDAGFGEGREFDVIAAAVLGGASLFGGIGGAASAVLGALTIQAVKAGSSSRA